MRPPAGAENSGRFRLVGLGRGGLRLDRRRRGRGFARRSRHRVSSLRRLGALGRSGARPAPRPGATAAAAASPSPTLPVLSSRRRGADLDLCLGAARNRDSWLATRDRGFAALECAARRPRATTTSWAGRPGPTTRWTSTVAAGSIPWRPVAPGAAAPRAALAAAVVVRVSRGAGHHPAGAGDRDLARVHPLAAIAAGTAAEAAGTAATARAAGTAGATAAARRTAAIASAPAARVASAAALRSRRRRHPVEHVVKLADADRAGWRALALEHAHQAHVAEPFAGVLDHLEESRQPVAGHADLGADRLRQRVAFETFSRLAGAHFERATGDHTRKLRQCSHELPRMKKAVVRADDGRL
jgi:hypothetical protein